MGRVPAVGEDLSRLIKFLQDAADLHLDDIHLIGHSLGAHVSSFASKPLDGYIGRISAIDPASYGYREVDPSRRLDKSDAKLVDVIHTNACTRVTAVFLDCYGLNENIGHVDFWPNGGEHQPPCTEEDGIGVNVTEAPANCDHSIGIYYYIESISSSLLFPRFLAKACPSWDHYLNESCGFQFTMQYMGFYANQRLHGTFYLSIRKDIPFSSVDIFLIFTYFTQITGILVCIIIFIIVFVEFIMNKCENFLKDENTWKIFDDIMLSSKHDDNIDPCR